MDKNTPSSIGIAIAAIVFGLTIFINPVGFNLKFGIYYDFSDIKWFLGGIFVSFGLIYILITLRTLKKERQSYLLCAKCNEKFKSSSNKSLECPKCHGLLESVIDDFRKSNIIFEIPNIKMIFWVVIALLLALLAIFTPIWLFFSLISN